MLPTNAEVNFTNRVGHTPLYDCADHKGTVEIVKILLDAGADTNIAAIDTGKTPLEIAIERGHKEITDALWQYGAKE